MVGELRNLAERIEEIAKVKNKTGVTVGMEAVSKKAS